MSEEKKEEQKAPEQNAEEKPEVSSEPTEDKSASASAKAAADKSAPADAKAEAGKDAAADKGKDVKVPAKFKSLVEEIEKMAVLDLAELVKILEDKFGVSAAAPVAAVAAAPAGGGDAGETEEKSSFDVELTEPGGSKIAVIKAVREITQQGLKDAKDMVDGAPKVIKEAVAKAEAEEMKKKLEEAGAKVTLK